MTFKALIDVVKAQSKQIVELERAVHGTNAFKPVSMNFDQPRINDDTPTESANLTLDGNN